MTKPIKKEVDATGEMQQEAQLMAALESLGNHQFDEKCKTLMELSLLYLKVGAMERLLHTLEQLDSALIERPITEFIVFVYYVRAELAYFYSDWTYLVDYCETGISIAMRNQSYMYVAQFYKMLHQVALLNHQYEQSRIYCKLALYFTRKNEVFYESLVIRCQIGLLKLNYIQQKEQSAQKIVQQCVIREGDEALTVLLKQLLHSIVYGFETGEWVVIDDLLDELWAVHKQYNLVKSVILFLDEYLEPSICSQRYEHFMTAFEMTEAILQRFEKLAYHDQLRAVSITNGQDEKIGYTSGERYRQELQQKIDEALPEQFITIVTFIIKVNEPDLLSRHLKIKYDYYMKIDRELKAFYPESTRGKYYPSSFCSMFVTNEPVDLISLGQKIQIYLDGIDLQLEDKKIEYYFFAGAAIREKQHVTTLHELYQHADQSLYYATVSKKPIVVYGK